MLTGSLPFRGDSAFAVLRSHCDDAASRPLVAQLRARSGELDRIVLRSAEQGALGPPDRRSSCSTSCPTTSRRADEAARGRGSLAVGARGHGDRRRPRRTSRSTGPGPAPGPRGWATPSSPSRTTARPRPGIPRGSPSSASRSSPSSTAPAAATSSSKATGPGTESAAFTTLTTPNTVADLEFASAAVPFSVAGRPVTRAGRVAAPLPDQRRGCRVTRDGSRLPPERRPESVIRFDNATERQASTSGRWREPSGSPAACRWAGALDLYRGEWEDREQRQRGPGSPRADGLSCRASSPTESAATP